MSASASESRDIQLPTERAVLHTAWRAAASLSVVLLACCCREARKLHSKYKDNKQVLEQLTMPLFLQISSDESGVSDGVSMVQCFR